MDTCSSTIYFTWRNSFYYLCKTTASSLSIYWTQFDNAGYAHGIYAINSSEVLLNIEIDVPKNSIIRKITLSSNSITSDWTYTTYWNTICDAILNTIYLNSSDYSMYNLVNIDYVMLFMVFNATNGNQLQNKFMSNNTANWVGQTSNSMILQGFKLYITYYCVNRGILVYDTVQHLFTESYEYVLSSNQMNLIYIYNNRIYAVGYDSSNGYGTITSGNLEQISILPDISNSSIGMTIIGSTVYTIQSFIDSPSFIAVTATSGFASEITI